MAAQREKVRLPAGVGVSYWEMTPRYEQRLLGAALAASDEERLAAARVTELLLRRADVVDEDGPLVHGWAVHAAFLAGVRWQRLRDLRER